MRRFLKQTSVGILIFFIFTNVFGVPSLGAQNPVGSPIPLEIQREIFSIPEKISIPQEYGAVQEDYRGQTNKRFVVFIQDAHAIVDAQTNIQNLINYFSEKYGVGLVALEGGKGKLDSTLLRAFPDEKIKKTVMGEYLGRGELSGAQLAAVMNFEEASYFGIEDWPLYEAHYIAYLRAMKNEKAVLEELDAKEKELDVERSKIYSPEHNEFHEKVAAFRGEKLQLLDFLKYLQLKTSNLGLVTGEKYPHVKTLMDSIERDSGIDYEMLDREIRNLCEAFRKESGRKLTKDQLQEFNGKFQEFVTGRGNAAGFLKYLISLSESLGAELELSPSMKSLLGHEELLCSIKGTKVFEELEGVIGEAEEKLSASPEEKALGGKYGRLAVLRDMAKLELNREKLEKIQAETKEYLSLLSEPSLIKPHFDFYGYAVARDEVLQKNLEELMAREKKDSAIVVLGGFHRSGFEKRLKEKGISFCTITPRINCLTGAENYDLVMEGELSYKEYLKTTFYDAFMRSSSMKLVAGLNEPDFRRVIKVWRDGVIRRLAEEGRIAEAREYTKYVDLLVKVYVEKFGTESLEKRSKEEILRSVENELTRFQENFFAKAWEKVQSRVGNFTNQLRLLVDRNESTETNVKAAIEEMEKPSALAASLGALMPDLPCDLLRGFVLGELDVQELEVKLSSELLRASGFSKLAPDDIRSALRTVAEQTTRIASEISQMEEVVRGSEALNLLVQKSGELPEARTPQVTRQLAETIVNDVVDSVTQKIPDAGLRQIARPQVARAILDKIQPADDERKLLPGQTAQSVIPLPSDDEKEEIPSLRNRGKKRTVDMPVDVLPVQSRAGQPVSELSAVGMHAEASSLGGEIGVLPLSSIGEEIEAFEKEFLEGTSFRSENAVMMGKKPLVMNDALAGLMRRAAAEAVGKLSPRSQAKLNRGDVVRVIVRFEYQGESYSADFRAGLVHGRLIVVRKNLLNRLGMTPQEYFDFLNHSDGIREQLKGREEKAGAGGIKDPYLVVGLEKSEHLFGSDLQGHLLGVNIALGQAVRDGKIARGTGEKLLADAMTSEMRDSRLRDEVENFDIENQWNSNEAEALHREIRQVAQDSESGGGARAGEWYWRSGVLAWKIAQRAATVGDSKTAKRFYSEAGELLGKASACFKSPGCALQFSAISGRAARFSEQMRAEAGKIPEAVSSPNPEKPGRIHQRIADLTAKSNLQLVALILIALSLVFGVAAARVSNLATGPTGRETETQPVDPLQRSGGIALPRTIDTVNDGDYDLVVVGSTSSGISSAIAAKRANPNLRIAIVTSATGDSFEDMRVNGLGNEDAMRVGELRTGLSAEFNQLAAQYMLKYHYPKEPGVLRTLKAWANYDPSNPPSRCAKYAPDAARYANKELLRRANGLEGPPIILIRGSYVESVIQSENAPRVIVLGGKVPMRISGRTFVDATPSADLARKCGVQYRLGDDSAYYSDQTGIPPAPTEENHYRTATQALSPLLTLREYQGGIPQAARAVNHPYYESSGAAAQWQNFKEAADRLRARGKFPSWRSTWAYQSGVLGGGYYELNENQDIVTLPNGAKVFVGTDYLNPQDVHDYIYYPEKRPEITQRAFSNSLNWLRYHQEVMEDSIGLGEIHQQGDSDSRTVYLREGVRIKGNTTYQSNQPIAGAMSFREMKRVLEVPEEHSVMTFSYMADAHHAYVDRSGNMGGGFWNTAPGKDRRGTPIIEMPYGALSPEGIPDLLVTEAVSADRNMYAIARMEPAKAMLGQAAGNAVALSLATGRSLEEVDVPILQKMQAEQGVQVFYHDLGDQTVDVRADGIRDLTVPRINLTQDELLAVGNPDRVQVRAGSPAGFGLLGAVTELVGVGLPGIRSEGAEHVREGALSSELSEGLEKISGPFGPDRVAAVSASSLGNARDVDRAQLQAKLAEMFSRLTGIPEEFQDYRETAHFNWWFHREGGRDARLEAHLLAVLEGLERIDDDEFYSGVPAEAREYIRKCAQENRSELEAFILLHDIGKKQSVKPRTTIVETDGGQKEVADYYFTGHEEESFSLLRQYGSQIKYQGEAIAPFLRFVIQNHNFAYERDGFENPDPAQNAELIKSLKAKFDAAQIDYDFERMMEFLIAVTALDFIGSRVDDEGKTFAPFGQVENVIAAVKKWKTDQASSLGTEFEPEIGKILIDEKGDVIYRNPRGLDGLNLPAERFGSADGRAVNPLRLLFETAGEVFGRHGISEIPLVSAIGSTTYLLDEKGLPDWDRIDDIDLRLHTKEMLNAAIQKEILDDFLTKLQAALGNQVEGTSEELKTLYDRTTGHGYPVSLFFAERNSLFGAGNEWDQFRPGHVFYGNISGLNKILSAGVRMRGGKIDDLLSNALLYYRRKLADAVAMESEGYTGLKNRKLEMVKRLYEIAALRGVESDFRELLDVYTRTRFDELEADRVCRQAISRLKTDEKILRRDLARFFEITGEASSLGDETVYDETNARKQEILSLLRTVYGQDSRELFGDLAMVFSDELDDFSPGFYERAYEMTANGQKLEGFELDDEHLNFLLSTLSGSKPALEFGKNFMLTPEEEARGLPSTPGGFFPSLALDTQGRLMNRRLKEALHVEWFVSQAQDPQQMIGDGYFWDGGEVFVYHLPKMAETIAAHSEFLRRHIRDKNLENQMSAFLEKWRETDKTGGSIEGLRDELNELVSGLFTDSRTHRDAIAGILFGYPESDVEAYLEGKRSGQNNTFLIDAGFRTQGGEDARQTVQSWRIGKAAFLGAVFELLIEDEKSKDRFAGEVKEGKSLGTEVGRLYGFPRLYELLKSFTDNGMDSIPADDAVADVHGDFLEFDQMLKELWARGITEAVALGDYMDRGNLSFYVYRLLREYEGRGKEVEGISRTVVPLMGNHDLMFLMAMMGDGHEFLQWLGNGGINVLKEGSIGLRDPALQFQAEAVKNPEKDFYHQIFYAYKHDRAFQKMAADLFSAVRRNERLREMADWMKANLRLYHLDQLGRFYVHAGVPVDEEGNSLLAYKGFRGLAALAKLEEDMAEAFRWGDPDAEVFKWLMNPNWSPLWVRQWEDRVRDPDGFANEMGVTTITVGHMAYGGTKIVEGGRIIVASQGSHAQRMKTGESLIPQKLTEWADPARKHARIVLSGLPGPTGASLGEDERLRHQMAGIGDAQRILDQSGYESIRKELERLLSDMGSVSEEFSLKNPAEVFENEITELAAHLAATEDFPGLPESEKMKFPSYRRFVKVIHYLELYAHDLEDMKNYLAEVERNGEVLWGVFLAAFDKVPAEPVEAKSVFISVFSRILTDRRKFSSPQLYWLPEQEAELKRLAEWFGEGTEIMRGVFSKLFLDSRQFVQDLQSRPGTEDLLRASEKIFHASITKGEYYRILFQKKLLAACMDELKKIFSSELSDGETIVHYLDENPRQLLATHATQPDYLAVMAVLGFIGYEAAREELGGKLERKSGGVMPGVSFQVGQVDRVFGQIPNPYGFYHPLYSTMMEAGFEYFQMIEERKNGEYGVFIPYRNLLEGPDGSRVGLYAYDEWNPFVADVVRRKILELGRQGESQWLRDISGKLQWGGEWYERHRKGDDSFWPKAGVKYEGMARAVALWRRMGVAATGREPLFIESFQKGEFQGEILVSNETGGAINLHAEENQAMLLVSKANLKQFIGNVITKAIELSSTEVLKRKIAEQGGIENYLRFCLSFVVPYEEANLQLAMLTLENADLAEVRAKANQEVMRVAEPFLHVPGSVSLTASSLGDQEKGSPSQVLARELASMPYDELLKLAGVETPAGESLEESMQKDISLPVGPWFAAEAAALCQTLTEIVESVKPQVDRLRDEMRTEFGKDKGPSLPEDSARKIYEDAEAVVLAIAESEHREDYLSLDWSVQSGTDLNNPAISVPWFILHHTMEDRLRNVLSNVGGFSRRMERHAAEKKAVQEDFDIINRDVKKKLVQLIRVLRILSKPRETIPLKVVSRLVVEIDFERLIEEARNTRAKALGEEAEKPLFRVVVLEDEMSLKRLYEIRVQAWARSKGGKAEVMVAHYGREALDEINRRIAHGKDGRIFDLVIADFGTLIEETGRGGAGAWIVEALQDIPEDVRPLAVIWSAGNDPVQNVFPGLVEKRIVFEALDKVKGIERIDNILDDAYGELVSRGRIQPIAGSLGAQKGDAGTSGEVMPEFDVAIWDNDQFVSWPLIDLPAEDVEAILKGEKPMPEKYQLSIANRELLERFLRPGKALALISGGDINNLSMRVAQVLNPDARSRIIAAHCGGRQVFEFNKKGELIEEPVIDLVTEQFKEIGASPEERANFEEQWMRVIDRVEESFGLREHIRLEEISIPRVRVDRRYDRPGWQKGRPVQVTFECDQFNDDLNKLADETKLAVVAIINKRIEECNKEIQDFNSEHPDPESHVKAIAPVMLTERGYDLRKPLGAYLNFLYKKGKAAGVRGFNLLILLEAGTGALDTGVGKIDKRITARKLIERGILQKVSGKRLDGRRVLVGDDSPGNVVKMLQGISDARESEVDQPDEAQGLVTPEKEIAATDSVLGSVGGRINVINGQYGEACSGITRFMERNVSQSLGEERPQWSKDKPSYVFLDADNFLWTGTLDLITDIYTEIFWRAKNGVDVQTNVREEQFSEAKEFVREFLGRGMHRNEAEQLLAILEEAQRHRPGRELANTYDDYVGLFEKRFREKFSQYVKIIGGVPGFLDAIQEKKKEGYDIHLVLLSNGSQFGVDLLSEFLQIRGSFDRVIGVPWNLSRGGYSKADHIIQVASEYPGAFVAMGGDSVGDMNAARIVTERGMPAVGFAALTGFTSAEKLRQGGAVAVVQNLGEFEQIFSAFGSIPRNVHPLQYLQNPVLREFIEEMLKKRYTHWGLPDELAYDILRILSEHADNPALAREELYKVFRFKTDPRWGEAYSAYKAKVKYDAAYEQISRFIEGLPPGFTLLDVGCGGNDFGRAIVGRTDARVIGTDIYVYDSPDKSANPGYLKQPDAIHLPPEIANASVDVVTMNAVAHHISDDDFQSLLGEIKRVLKPGGRVILIEDTYSSEFAFDPLSDGELTDRFLELVKEQGEDFARAYFAFNDWYSNIVVHEWDDMNMEYNFHSIESWQEILGGAGFESFGAKHVGFPAEGFHKPDLGAIAFTYRAAEAQAVAAETDTPSAIQGRIQPIAGSLGEDRLSRLGPLELIEIEGVVVDVPGYYRQRAEEMLTEVGLEKSSPGAVYFLIRPIDVLKVMAKRLGVEDGRIRILVGDYYYVDKSADGSVLEISLPKYSVLNEGFQTTLSRLLAIALDSINIAGIFSSPLRSDWISESIQELRFGRYLQGEGQAYPIPTGREKAYYSGKKMQVLRAIAAGGGVLKGGKSDGGLKTSKGTTYLWASQDPGLAEWHGRAGKGAVLRFNKEAVDGNFHTDSGWQFGLVNEVMIFDSQGGDAEIPLTPDYLEEILVLDAKSLEEVRALYLAIPVRLIETPEDAEAYLREKGEMTNEELEKYYFSPENLARSAERATDPDFEAFARYIGFNPKEIRSLRYGEPYLLISKAFDQKAGEVQKELDHIYQIRGDLERYRVLLAREKQSGRERMDQYSLKTLDALRTGFGEIDPEAEEARLSEETVRLNQFMETYKVFKAQAAIRSEAFQVGIPPSTETRIYLRTSDAAVAGASLGDDPGVGPLLVDRESGRIQYRNHVPIEIYDLPVWMFGEKAGGLNLVRLMAEAAGEVLGEKPLIAVTGSLTYLFREDGTLDWENVGDFDFCIYSRSKAVDGNQIARRFSMLMAEKLGEEGGGGNRVVTPARKYELHVFAGEYSELSYRQSHVPVGYRLGDIFYGTTTELNRVLSEKGAGNIIRDGIRYCQSRLADAREGIIVRRTIPGSQMIMPRGMVEGQEVFVRSLMLDQVKKLMEVAYLTGRNDLYHDFQGKYDLLKKGDFTGRKKSEIFKEIGIGHQELDEVSRALDTFGENPFLRLIEWEPAATTQGESAQSAANPRLRHSAETSMVSASLGGVTETAEILPKLIRTLRDSKIRENPERVRQIVEPYAGMLEVLGRQIEREMRAHGWTLDFGPVDLASINDGNRILNLSFSDLMTFLLNLQRYLDYSGVVDIIRDPDLREPIAEHQHKAYERHQKGREASYEANPMYDSASADNPVGLTEKELAVGTNMAGFFAGVATVQRFTGMSVVQVLEEIIRYKDAVQNGADLTDIRLSGQDVNLLMRFANATWMAGTAFRGLEERMAKNNFTLWDLLPGDERYKDLIQCWAAAKFLRERISPDLDADQQLQKLGEILRDPELSDQIAKNQSAAYQEEERRKNPDYQGSSLDDLEDRKKISGLTVKDAAIATNLAGFYALVTGIGALRERFPRRAEQTFIGIVNDISKGTLNPDEMDLLMRFANATWMAGTAFRGLKEQMEKRSFVLWDQLSEEDKDKAKDQIFAAAEQLGDLIKAQSLGQGTNAEVIGPGGDEELLRRSMAVFRHEIGGLLEGLMQAIEVDFDMKPRTGKLIEDLVKNLREVREVVHQLETSETGKIESDRFPDLRQRIKRLRSQLGRFLRRHDQPEDAEDREIVRAGIAGLNVALRRLDSLGKSIKSGNYKGVRQTMGLLRIFDDVQAFFLPDLKANAKKKMKGKEIGGKLVPWGISVEDQSEGAMVKVDRNHLEGVWVNLIRNAVKAGATEINIKIFTEGENVFVTVSDNGSGIPPGIFPRIFEPDFSGTGSTGLGFFLSQRIVEAAGGEILEPVSEAGKGTVFKVVLPRAMISSGSSDKFEKSEMGQSLGSRVSDMIRVLGDDNFLTQSTGMTAEELGEAVQRMQSADEIHQFLLEKTKAKFESIRENMIADIKEFGTVLDGRYSGAEEMLAAVFSDAFEEELGRLTDQWSAETGAAYSGEDFSRLVLGIRLTVFGETSSVLALAAGLEGNKETSPEAVAHYLARIQQGIDAMLQDYGKTKVNFALSFRDNDEEDLRDILFQIQGLIGMLFLFHGRSQHVQMSNWRGLGTVVSRLVNSKDKRNSPEAVLSGIQDIAGQNLGVLTANTAVFPADSYGKGLPVVAADPETVVGNLKKAYLWSAAAVVVAVALLKEPKEVLRDEEALKAFLGKYFPQEFSDLFSLENGVLKIKVNALTEAIQAAEKVAAAA